MGYEEILTNKEKSKVLARVVSHLMGDGCVTNKYFAYYNKNLILLSNFQEDINTLFKNIHLIKGKVNSGTSFIMIQNKEVNNFLKSLLRDYRSHSLQMPNFVNKIELQIEFLKALYDDEGCVALRTFKKTNEIKRNLTLSSNSLILLQEIKRILENNFNINSNKILKYTKTRGSHQYINYVLSITGKENFINFRDKINFNHPNKKRKLDLMINSYIKK